VAAIFGDARLNKLACTVIDALGQKPNISIPAALAGRVKDNEKITPDKFLQPHGDATYNSVKQDDYVLMVQDTSELDLTRPQRQATGAGPMDFETPRGAFFHPVAAFR
jgi:hypothetical protein